jgi:FtsZ-binding cell division protein ZapB
MSWFTSGLEALNNLSEKVQKAIPLDKELLAKLTLNTDEMKAQRQQFGDEANRKKDVKNMLAGMLPWETKDPERDILVEECKEAILALSGREETFHGPYEMPALRVKLDDDNDEETQEGEDPDDGDDKDESESAEKSYMPSEESLEKLAKLEPLPPLLCDFDLDSHVGLIERLLKEDPVLAERQSTLSGKCVRCASCESTAYGLVFLGGV